MIRHILVSRRADSYLKRHRLVKHFLKALHKLKKGDNRGVDLKKRNPHSDQVWQFRITKKYRAFARKNGDVLTVFKISDHQ